MKAIHQCLLQQYGEVPLPPPSERYGGENVVWGMYGDGDRPLVALGSTNDRHLYLGTPHLVWSGPHRPDWSFKPVWPIPEQWGNDLDEAHAAELLTQARKVATRRKRQYRRCHSCGESPMPEHMDMSFHGKPTCHSCMETQGVLF